MFKYMSNNTSVQSQKKVLILYTSVGLGHKAIAENLAKSLKHQQFLVKLVDAYEAQDGKLISIGKKIHSFMNVQAPWLWSFFYKSRIFTNLSMGLRLKVAAKNYRNILAAISAFNPEAVISTQAAPSGVVAYLKQQGLYKGKFGIAFSDFHLHRYWLYGQADFYLANIGEQKQEMVSLGVPPERIYITGFSMPLQPVVDVVAVRSRLGIKPGQKVILVASGSLGRGLDEQLLSNLSVQKDWHTILVCGKNQEAYERLSKKFSKTNFSVFGFYTPLSELYAASDIFLTKPGGLSVMESLQWGLPMIITSMLPGQEELNMQFLLKNNFVMLKQKNILQQMRQELTTGTFRQQLMQNEARTSLLNGQNPGEILKQLLV